MKLKKFQTQEFSGWKGLTKDNHLSTAFGSPKVEDAVMLRIMDYNYGLSLESFLRQFPTKLMEDDTEIVWKLVGSSRRNIPLVEARDFNGNVIGVDDMAGVNTEPFYLVFSEDYFADGNVVVGEKNEVYPLRVLADPKVEGTHYVYQVELMGGVVTGMPGDELQYGKRFSDDFSPVEKELSRKVGDVRFSTPIAMREEFSRIRLQHKVAGNKLNKKVAVGLPMRHDKTGKETVSNYWMHYEAWAVEEQFSSDKNHCIAYGTSNRTTNGEYLNYGKSGNILQTGAGVREQMSYGNTTYFNRFSIKLVEDILYNLDNNNTGKVVKKLYVLDTGKRGAMKFHKAVMDMASGWQAFGYFGGNDKVSLINKVSSDMHDNAFTAGFQFVQYDSPMGISVKVQINPMKDDPVRNKILHPEGGPAESYRYDIYSLGNTSIPNVQLVKVKGQEDFRGYQWGFRNPFTGQVDNQNMSFDEDAAVIHRYAVLGAVVYNPNDCVSLIPAILA